VFAAIPTDPSGRRKIDPRRAQAAIGNERDADLERIAVGYRGGQEKIRHAAWRRCGGGPARGGYCGNKLN
jgi:hypothetical protein